MLFDWLSIEEQLFEQTHALIKQFATEHPNEVCSFFVYAWMPIEANFSLYYASSILPSVY